MQGFWYTWGYDGCDPDDLQRFMARVADEGRESDDDGYLLGECDDGARALGPLSSGRRPPRGERQVLGSGNDDDLLDDSFSEERGDSDDDDDGRNVVVPSVRMASAPVVAPELPPFIVAATAVSCSTSGASNINIRGPGDECERAVVLFGGAVAADIPKEAVRCGAGFNEGVFTPTNQLWVKPLGDCQQQQCGGSSLFTQARLETKGPSSSSSSSVPPALFGHVAVGVSPPPSRVSASPHRRAVRMMVGFGSSAPFFTSFHRHRQLVADMWVATVTFPTPGDDTTTTTADRRVGSGAVHSEPIVAWQPLGFAGPEPAPRVFASAVPLRGPPRHTAAASSMAGASHGRRPVTAAAAPLDAISPSARIPTPSSAAAAAPPDWDAVTPQPSMGGSGGSPETQRGAARRGAPATVADSATTATATPVPTSVSDVGALDALFPSMLMNGPDATAAAADDAEDNEPPSYCLIFGGQLANGLPTAELLDVMVLPSAKVVNCRAVDPEKVAGYAPEARYGHSATTTPDGDMMVVVGGVSRGQRYTGDCYVLDMSAGWLWREILVPSGFGVSTRAFHTAVWATALRAVVVCGGEVNELPVADSWAIDPAADSAGDAERQWRRLYDSVVDAQAQQLSTVARGRDATRHHHELPVATVGALAASFVMDNSANGMDLVTLGGVMPNRAKVAKRQAHVGGVVGCVGQRMRHEKSLKFFAAAALGLLGDATD